MKKAAILILAVSVLLTAALFASNQESKAPMKQALIKLNYIRAQYIVTLLQPYCSREGRINYVPDGKILTLTDYPENVEKIMAVVKEIDAKPADVLFKVQLVLASEDGAAKTDESLANDPIIKELKGFLKYKSFSLLDTSLVRGTDRQESAIAMGVSGEFALEMTPDTSAVEGSESVRVFVRLKQLFRSSEVKVAGDLTEWQSQTLIDSSLTMKSGDKTVVGVSRTAGGDKGLILIISAKIVE